jgi:ketosteroid isomerase-like protein
MQLQSLQHERRSAIAATIRRLHGDWLDAEGERDLPRLVRMVTDDFVLLRPGAPAIEGRQALEDLYRAVWASTTVDRSARIREIRVTGDWGWVCTDDDMTFTPNAGTSCFHLTGNSMAIVQCSSSSSGIWKFARLITNVLPDRRG